MNNNDPLFLKKEHHQITIKDRNLKPPQMLDNISESIKVEIFLGNETVVMAITKGLWATGQ